MKVQLILMILMMSYTSFSQQVLVDQELITKRIQVNTKYIGNYELPGKSARITMKEEGLLWLFVPGMPECQLVFYMPHVFTLEGIPDYELEFLPRKDGTIKALIFKQPDKTVNARKKD